jgi:hypothetical protein
VRRRRACYSRGSREGWLSAARSKPPWQGDREGDKISLKTDCGVLQIVNALDEAEVLAAATDFNKQISEIDYNDVLVLKLHLLLEQKLELIIKQYSANEDQINSANLRFAQKLSIARALSPIDDKHDIWELILKLNSARNELAHSLNRDKYNTKLNSLFQQYELSSSKLEAEFEFDKLEFQHKVILAGSMMLGFLEAGLRDAKLRGNLMKYAASAMRQNTNND